nr:hypothetical protein [uncultured Arsenicibacter sp.]
MNHVISNVPSDRRRGLLYALILGLIAAGPAVSQDAKLKRDVTYSTHNYKHPNKAQVARKWEQSPSVRTSDFAGREVVTGDYKKPATIITQQPTPQLAFEVKPEREINRNYKAAMATQFADRKKKAERQSNEPVPADGGN